MTRAITTSMCLNAKSWLLEQPPRKDLQAVIRSTASTAPLTTKKKHKKYRKVTLKALLYRDPCNCINVS